MNSLMILSPCSKIISKRVEKLSSIAEILISISLMLNWFSDLLKECTISSIAKRVILKLSSSLYSLFACWKIILNKSIISCLISSKKLSTTLISMMLISKKSWSKSYVKEFFSSLLKIIF